MKMDKDTVTQFEKEYSKAISQRPFKPFNRDPDGSATRKLDGDKYVETGLSLLNKDTVRSTMRKPDEDENIETATSKFKIEWRKSNSDVFRRDTGPSKGVKKYIERFDYFILERLPSITLQDFPTEKNQPSINEVFDYVERREFRLLSNAMPSNQFEEWIRWTQDGKLWKFPIDNEEGLDEEQQIGFHEHVFLEWWCPGLPRNGPIANFMDLVCIGLSKNPYLSVPEKQEHINWLAQYLKEKVTVVEKAIAEAEQQREYEQSIQSEIVD